MNDERILKCDTVTLEKLIEYCVAFANELGGTLVLGVTDVIPRQVGGTSCFSQSGGN